MGYSLSQCAALIYFSLNKWLVSSCCRQAHRSLRHQSPQTKTRQVCILLLPVQKILPDNGPSLRSALYSTLLQNAAAWPCPMIICLLVFLMIQATDLRQPLFDNFATYLVSLPFAEDTYETILRIALKNDSLSKAMSSSPYPLARSVCLLSEGVFPVFLVPLRFSFASIARDKIQQTAINR